MFLLESFIFLKQMITALGYINMLRTLTMLKMCQLYGAQKFYSQHDVTFELSVVTLLNFSGL